MAESFFYTNDLKVLMDVIIRELNDLPATERDRNRQLYLLILEPFLRNTDFRKTLYRAADLTKTLKQFEDYIDKDVKTNAARLVTLISDFQTIERYSKAFSAEFGSD